MSVTVSPSYASRALDREEATAPETAGARVDSPRKREEHIRRGQRGAIREHEAVAQMEGVGRGIFRDVDRLGQIHLDVERIRHGDERAVDLTRNALVNAGG